MSKTLILDLTASEWALIVTTTDSVTLQAADAPTVEVFIDQEAPVAVSEGLRLRHGDPPISFKLDAGDQVHARIKSHEPSAGGRLLKWE